MGSLFVMVRSTRPWWYFSQSMRTQALQGTMSKPKVGRSARSACNLQQLPSNSVPALC